MTRVAVVVQRFGLSIVGGAETHALMLIQRFRQDLNWSVDVYTTAASDYRTWRSDIPQRVEDFFGAKVFRFRTIIERQDRLMALLMFVLRVSRKLLRISPKWLESLWLVAQGPFAPELVREIVARQKDYDAILFFTYLYHPTAAALPQCNAPTVLVPTAHDEPPFYLNYVSRILSHTTTIAANTEAEADLISKTHQIDRAKIRIVGLGFEPGAKGTAPIPEKYVLYLGRIGRGKSVDELIRYFLDFNAENLVLVLAGKVETDIQIPNDPRIKLVGFLNEDEKWRYIHGCELLINPSKHESLSMVAIEAMAVSKPLLLTEHCAVFRAYRQLCPSVRTYRDSHEFAEKLREILNANWLMDPHQNQLQVSRSWALSHYSWPTVMKKYADIVQGKKSLAG